MKQRLPTRTEVRHFIQKNLSSLLTEPTHLSALVAEVADKMDVSLEAREVKCKSGHGADYTLLGSYVLFSLVDLQKDNAIRLLGENYWQVNTGKDIGQIKRRDIDEAIMNLRQLAFAGITDIEERMILLLDRWNEAVLTAAAKKLSQTA